MTPSWEMRWLLTLLPSPASLDFAAKGPGWGPPEQIVLGLLGSLRPASRRTGGARECAFVLGAVSNGGLPVQRGLQRLQTGAPRVLSQGQDLT